MLVSVIMSTVTIPLGLGKHIEAVPVENLSGIGLRGNINGTFSVLAAAWSKTSFALTLLRLMGQEKWANRFLWFAIVTMNLFLFGNALFQWIKCWPISKTWNVMEAGTCWPPGIQSKYGMFAGGALSRPIKIPRCTTDHSGQDTRPAWTSYWHSCPGS